jgi:hypothetical protein
VCVSGRTQSVRACLHVPACVRGHAFGLVRARARVRVPACVHVSPCVQSSRRGPTAMVRERRPMHISECNTCAATPAAADRDICRRWPTENTDGDDATPTRRCCGAATSLLGRFPVAGGSDRDWCALRCMRARAMRGRDARDHGLAACHAACAASTEDSRAGSSYATASAIATAARLRSTALRDWEGGRCPVVAGVRTDDDAVDAGVAGVVCPVVCNQRTACRRRAHAEPQGRYATERAPATGPSDVRPVLPRDRACTVTHHMHGMLQHTLAHASRGGVHRYCAGAW